MMAFFCRAEVVKADHVSGRCAFSAVLWIGNEEVLVAGNANWHYEHHCPPTIDCQIKVFEPLQSQHRCG